MLPSSRNEKRQPGVVLCAAARGTWAGLGTGSTACVLVLQALLRDNDCAYVLTPMLKVRFILPLPAPSAVLGAIRSLLCMRLSCPIYACVRGHSAGTCEPTRVTSPVVNQLPCPGVRVQHATLGKVVAVVLLDFLISQQMHLLEDITVRHMHSHAAIVHSQSRSASSRAGVGVGVPPARPGITVACAEALTRASG